MLTLLCSLQATETQGDSATTVRGRSALTPANRKDARGVPRWGCRGSLRSGGGQAARAGSGRADGDWGLLFPECSLGLSAHFRGLWLLLGAGHAPAVRDSWNERPLSAAITSPPGPGPHSAVTPGQPAQWAGCPHTVPSAEGTLSSGQLGPAWLGTRVPRRVQGPGAGACPGSAQYRGGHSRALKARVYYQNLWGTDTAVPPAAGGCGEMSLWHQAPRPSCCELPPSRRSPRPPALCTCAPALAREGSGGLLSPARLAPRPSPSQPLATAQHRGRQPAALPQGSSEA